MTVQNVYENILIMLVLSVNIQRPAFSTPFSVRKLFLITIVKLNSFVELVSIVWGLQTIWPFSCKNGNNKTGY